MCDLLRNKAIPLDQITTTTTTTTESGHCRLRADHTADTEHHGKSARTAETFPASRRCNDTRRKRQGHRSLCSNAAQRKNAPKWRKTRRNGQKRGEINKSGPLRNGQKRGEIDKSGPLRNGRKRAALNINLRAQPHLSIPTINLSGPFFFSFRFVFFRSGLPKGEGEAIPIP